MSASRLLMPLLAFAVALAWSAPGDARGRGGGGGAARASAHGSVSGDNVNRGNAVSSEDTEAGTMISRRRFIGVFFHGTRKTSRSLSTALGGSLDASALSSIAN